MSTDSQGESQAAPIGLPAPKWCFVLLGVPTFYMPLAYLLLVGWTFFGFVYGIVGDPPKALHYALVAGFYVTLVMWPIYLAWIALSKRLTLREKAYWLFMVVLTNIAGMPIFYVSMFRRYLGLKGRTTQREKYNKRVLAECFIVIFLILLLYILGTFHSISSKDRVRTAMMLYAFSFDEYYINNGHIPDNNSIDDITNNFVMNNNRFIKETNVEFYLHNNAIEMSTQFGSKKKMKAVWAYKSPGESLTFIEN